MTEQPPHEQKQGLPSGADKSSHGRVKFRRLFEECWAPMRAVVEAQLHGALLETLAPLAKSLEEPEAKRVKTVLARDRAFVQAYLEALQPELSSAIRSFIENRAREGLGARVLSLIGHADSEFDAKIDQCAARLRNAVDDEFGAVKVRLMNLLHEYDLRDTESPFRLALFVRAVAGALRHMGVQEVDIMPLVPLISNALPRVVAPVYRQIETRLAAGGAGDTVQGWQATGMRGSSQGRGRTTTGLGGNTVPAGGGDAQTQSALLRLLERLQPAALPAPPVGQGGVAPGPGEGGAAPGAAPTGAISLDPALVSAINQALRVTATAAAAVSGSAPSGADPALTHELRRNLIDTASRKIDKLTIELVGLLFDRIQRDRHVPEPIKEQLARLQFPLLKVALSDPELFADPRQPARRLLDRIASTSIGWSPEGDDNQRYFEQVRNAVDGVIEGQGEASKAFETALEGFAAFLDEERTRDDDPVARARRALAEAENREILAIKATMQVRSAFDGVQLESYLRDFLLDVWVRVLVDATLREKSEPDLLRKYLDAIPELVWSVQPKINPDDRKRMISSIPTVLAVLREGLNRISWPAERVQQFFGRLMNSHASAVRALELAHGSLPQFAPSTVRIKLDGFRIPTETDDVLPNQVKLSDDVVRHALSASAAGVNHLEPPPQPAQQTASMDERRALDAIAAFSRGQWFDLRLDGGVERVVLRWISPKRALYLFTTPHGERAHSLSPDTLLAYLQSGWLLPAEPAPLFARAVDSMMSDLKHDVEGAAAPTV